MKTIGEMNRYEVIPIRCSHCCYSAGLQIQFTENDVQMKLDVAAAGLTYARAWTERQFYLDISQRSDENRTKNRESVTF